MIRRLSGLFALTAAAAVPVAEQDAPMRGPGVPVGIFASVPRSIVT